MKICAIASACAALFVASATQAALVDTFTRADGTVASNSIGQTEVGGFSYVERVAGATATPDGTAEIVNGELRLVGRLGSASQQHGGVLISDYESADVTLSTKVRFEHSIAAPTSAQQLANRFVVLLRARSDASLSYPTASAGNRGLLGIEIGANGDLSIREVRGEAGTLTAVTSINPITSANNASRRLAPGALPATINGQPFDVDQDGFIDGDESFDFGVTLNGTSLQIFINGLQYGSAFTVGESDGIAGNSVGLLKGTVSSSAATVTNVFIDNLDISPIPEPTMLGAIGCLGALVTRRRASTR